MPAEAQIIPRILIQTAKSRQLGALARGCVSALKLLHPDWEYLFFDDDDIARFVGSEFPEYRSVFEQFAHGVQRADFFRYLAVYRFGGFYFDLDVLLHTPVTNLCSHQCVFPFEELTLSSYLRQHGIDWEIGNYAFGAAPRHPFIGAVIDNCVRARRDARWVEPMVKGIPRPFRRSFMILNTTGPGLVTRTLAEQPACARQMTILYPSDVCDSTTWHNFGEYGIHIMEGSWRQDGGYLRRKAAAVWEAFTRRRLMLESCARGPKRYCPRIAAA